MATQEERSTSTRRRLLAAARTLFSRNGYNATAIDDITRAAELTKGAFYHHFPDKHAVFVTVFEAIEEELVRAATAAAVGDDAWQRFRAGCRAFLESSREPDVQRIVLRDGPAVLGWDKFREIDARYSLGLIEAGLRAAIAEGHIESASPATLAQLLLGMLCEGARLIAGDDRPREALERTREEIEGVFQSLGARRSERRPRKAAPTRRRSTQR